MNDESAGESMTSRAGDLHDGTSPPRGEGWPGAVNPGLAAGPVRYNSTTQEVTFTTETHEQHAVPVQHLQDSAIVQGGIRAEHEGTSAGNSDSGGARRRPVHSPVPMEEDPAPTDPSPEPRAVADQEHSAATQGDIVHLDVTVQDESVGSRPRTLHFIFPATDEMKYVAVPVKEVFGVTRPRTMHVTIRPVDGFSECPARRETRTVRFADPLTQVRVVEDEPKAGNNINKEEEDDGYRGVIYYGELMDEDPAPREQRPTQRRQGRRVRFTLPIVEEPAGTVPWTALLANPDFAGTDPQPGQAANPAQQGVGGSQRDAEGMNTDAEGVEVVALADADVMEVDVRVIEIDAERMETDDEGIEMDAERVETGSGETRHRFVHHTIDVQQDPTAAVPRGAQAAAAASAGPSFEYCVEREPPAEQRERSGPAEQVAAGARAASVVGRSLSFFKCYHCLLKQTCEVCRAKMTVRQMLAYRVLHQLYVTQRLWARKEKVRSLNAELQNREEEEEEEEEEESQEEEEEEEETPIE